MYNRINNFNNKGFYNSLNHLNKDILEPYIGPRPFNRTLEDQKKFFGRDYESREIISLIISHKLVLIYALSGAGKTSIFNGQIIPILEKYDGCNVLPVTRVKSLNIASSYLDVENLANYDNITNLYIYNALHNLKPELDSDLLKDKSLSEFLQEYFPIQKDENDNYIPQILIFDQLEEIFDIFPNNWQEQRKDFFNQVATALKIIKPLQSVFIIREDYLAQLDPYSSLLPEKLRPRFRLEKLREDAALLAIKGPLENISEKFIQNNLGNIEEYIKSIIKELMKIRVESTAGQTYQVDGEFVEPIQLQVVFKRWWEKIMDYNGKNIQQRKINVIDVDNALEDFYEESINEVIKETEISEDQIRKWFEQNLITSSATRNIVHRGFKSTAGLQNNAIDILKKKYLVKENWLAGSRWYELIHDRLINPIKLSNQRWKEENEKRKKSLAKKILIPSSSAVVIFIIFFTIWHNNLYIIEPVESIPAGSLPFIVSVDQNTGLVYVTNPKSDTVSVINGKRNDPMTTITVSDEPTAIAVDSNNNLVYVANSGNNTVSVINETNNKIINGTISIGSIDVRDGTTELAVDEENNFVYVVNNLSTDIQIIDIQLIKESLDRYNGIINKNIGYIITTIPVGNSSSDIAINPN
ncbi:MAG TPA: hypothetical protein VLA74_03425, partial [Nitrososphaeraceae archaeon]|nr:hypothetical protein [Nitrososphaeraceae archaeon]